MTIALLDFQSAGKNKIYFITNCDWLHLVHLRFPRVRSLTYICFEFPYFILNFLHFWSAVVHEHIAPYLCDKRQLRVPKTICFKIIWSEKLQTVVIISKSLPWLTPSAKNWVIVTSLESHFWRNKEHSKLTTFLYLSFPSSFQDLNLPNLHFL